MNEIVRTMIWRKSWMVAGKWSFRNMIFESTDRLHCAIENSSSFWWCNMDLITNFIMSFVFRWNFHKQIPQIFNHVFYRSSQQIIKYLLAKEKEEKFLSRNKEKVFPPGKHAMMKILFNFHWKCGRIHIHRASIMCFSFYIASLVVYLYKENHDRKRWKVSPKLFP